MDTINFKINFKIAAFGRKLLKELPRYYIEDHGNPNITFCNASQR